MTEEIPEEIIVEVTDTLARAREVAKRYSLRTTIPEEHCASDDTRLEWLWNQRLAVVQSIYMSSKSVRDKMAATLVLNAAWSAHLPSIELLIRRLEGGAVPDTVLAEGESLVI